METLANLESFVRSAESGSFSEAARRLSLTPAAVSRNVAMLERNLGVRLFQRSTRKLTLTETGERFLGAIASDLENLQRAIAEVASNSREPSGLLKVSVAPAFGLRHLVPLLPELRRRYPRVRLELHFENRQVDLIGEGYDVAIGGGVDLAPGIVSLNLASIEMILVASPDYLRIHAPPTRPDDLAGHDGIVMRSKRTGRMLHWTMRGPRGVEVACPLRESVVVDDPAAMREAALLGLGVTTVATIDAALELRRGELVRLLPRWSADAGKISLYYATRTLMPAKTRAFIDFVVESAQRLWRAPLARTGR